MYISRLIAICMAPLLLTPNSVLAKSTGADILMECDHKYGKYKFEIDLKNKRLFGQVKNNEWSDLTDWSITYTDEYMEYKNSVSFQNDGSILHTWSPQDPEFNYWVDYTTINPINGTLSIRHTASPKIDDYHYYDLEYTMPMKANEKIDETFKANCEVIAYPFKRNPKSFSEYLNKLTWRDGKRRSFQDLGGCESEYYDTIYTCAYGYLKISDPVNGKRLCELLPELGEVVRYNAPIENTSLKSLREGLASIKGSIGNCRNVLF